MKDAKSYFEWIANEPEVFMDTIDAFQQLKASGKTFFSFSQHAGFLIDMPSLEKTAIDLFKNAHPHMNSPIWDTRLWRMVCGITRFVNTSQSPRKHLWPLIWQMQGLCGMKNIPFHPCGIDDNIKIKHLTQWNPENLSEKGVIVATDQTTEPLLELWWKSYSKNNTYPVCFIDFGMSEKKRMWCEELGTVLSGTIADLPLFNRFCAPYLFFLKFYAILQTPFQKTLWLDIDCIVQRSLSPLFSALDSNKLALRRKDYDPIRCLVPGNCYFSSFVGEHYYNAGVILAEKGDPFLQNVLHVALKDDHFCPEGDAIFSRMAYLLEQKIYSLEPEANWNYCWGENPNAYLTHYSGIKGKQILNKKYGISLI